MAQDKYQWRALVNTILNLRAKIKCWEVLEYLHNWRLLKKGSAPYVSTFFILRYTKNKRTESFGNWT
jgi:hypothetical protein